MTALPLRSTLVVIIASLLFAACGGDDELDPQASAEIEAMANAPADESAGPDGLSSDELAIEPDSTIDPVANPEAEGLAYQELTWDDLLPADFDFQTIRDKINLDSYDIQNLSDDDPEAQRLYADLQSVMADVPFVYALDGQDTRMPGFLVPLEMEAEAVREFFLVPYFGACIHTPPPPANQIVHVVLEEPVPFDNIYEPYWAEGTMTVTRTETDLGTAGYRLQSAAIRPYE